MSGPGLGGREDWRQCLDWLQRCGVPLGVDHPPCQTGPTSAALSPPQTPGIGDGTQVFEFAQMLRDGVLLCHLANRLRPGVIDVKDFAQRPQMSQFLCLKNIRIFLAACKQAFNLKESDLFDAQNDLFDMKDFGKVLNTLSILSRSTDAQKLNIPPFTLALATGRRNQSQYYNSLPTMASEHGVSDEPMYGVVDCEHDDDEDDVYGRLVDRPITKTKANELRTLEGLARANVTGDDSLVAMPQDPLPKREMCIRELIVTEKNYVDALHMMKELFMKPLKEVLQPDDYFTIFLCIERFHEIHSGFHADLTAAYSASQDGQVTGRTTIADCFVTWKEKFLLYGEFCSNLPRAQELLDRLCASSPQIEQCVMTCQMRANEGRFKLRDLLSVPMQRVLKYHLLLKELIKLIKQTDRRHPERKSLERALEEMMDLSLYVNEVKRDNETLHLINEIESSIIDLQMPPNTSLKDYGRLLKDGELKIRVHSEQKTKTRYVFLFDKVLLMCKARGELYSYKHALVMSMYRVEDTMINVKANFGYPFILGQRNQFDAITIGAKTLELRQKWIEAMRMALDNTVPPFSHVGNHDFQMASFAEPTICDVCRKLLRGVFYQGYKCSKTSIVVHKECIEKASNMTGPPRPPPKPLPVRSLSTSQPQSSPADNPSSKTLVRALCGYIGVPSPPAGRPPLSIDIGNVIELVGEDGAWCEGIFNGCQGYFPKECVRAMGSAARQINVTTESIPTRKPKTVPQTNGASPGVLELSSAGRRPDLQSWVTQTGYMERMHRSMSEQSSPAAAAFSHSAGTAFSTSIGGMSSGGMSLGTQPLRYVDDLVSLGSGNSSAGTPNYFNLNPGRGFSADGLHEFDIYPWYVGGMSRDEASKKLERLPNGTYLIRVSQSDMRRGEYALSIKYGRDHPVKHIKLQQTSDNGNYFLADIKMFRSIPELVQYYQFNSLEVSFPEVPSVLVTPYKDAVAAQLKCGGSGVIDDSMILGYCVALYDYSAMEPNQISMKHGDRIAILSKAGGQRGWWKGINYGKIGYFPTTFVDELEEDDRPVSGSLPR